jgi:hypothetical protein
MMLRGYSEHPAFLVTRGQGGFRMSTLTLSLQQKKDLHVLEANLRFWSDVERLWENILTADERTQLGGDLYATFKTFRSAWAIWQHLRGGSVLRAIIDANYHLGTLTQVTHEQWRRIIGEPIEYDHTPTSGPNHNPDRPEWDAETGELRWHGEILRRLRLMRYPSALQRIVGAFQEANWRSVIPNPLLTRSAAAARSENLTLHQVLRSLNRNLLRIRFHGQNGGHYVRWEPR